MPDAIEWVLLVECSTMAELHTLRATLEARGVPCRIHGEHTHGVLGPIQGATMRSRVLVPRRALSLARSLVEDIVGPFDERPEDDEDEGDDASPFRTAAEIDPAEEADDGEDEADEDDEASSSREPAALAERRGPPPLRPRSYAVLVLIACMGGSFLGLAHLYVHRNLAAGIFVMISVFSLVALTGGAEWAPIVLATVWVLDLVGGLKGVYEDNRRLAQLEPAPELRRPEA